MLENPILLAALICFLLGLALSGLVRIVPGSTLASMVLPIVFLASYVLYLSASATLSSGRRNK